jgi:hypothetical protein
MADYTIVSSVNIKTGNKVRNIVSNRLYRFNNKLTWKRFSMKSYKIQDILLTNHGAHKELNNHNIYNIHNWIDLNTHTVEFVYNEQACNEIRLIAK